MIFNIFAYSEKKEFRQLVSNAMEAVTILGSVYGYEKFQKYVPKVIQELIKIQQMKIRQDPSEVDNQVSYLLSSWQRMAFLCNENLLPYIDNIMPSLLEVIKAPLWNMQEDEGASRTSNLEDMEIALQMISLFMKQYSKNLGKYLQEIYNILTLINVKIQNQELQISAFSLLPKIIKVAKDNQIDYKPLSKQIFMNLWEKFIEETESQAKQDYCFFMQEALANGGEIFAKEEIEAFVIKVEHELQNSEQRRKDFILNIDEEEEEEQTEAVQQEKEIQNEAEDQFKLEVANLFGKMFQSHKEKALSLFEHLLINHIQPCFANPSLINLEYAIFIIVDAIEYLGAYLPQQVLLQFYKQLMGYVSYANYEINQSVIYGIGLLAQIFKPVDFRSVFPEVLNQIVTFLGKPKVDQLGSQYYENCRDNFVSTLGKCMKA